MESNVYCAQFNMWFLKATPRRAQMYTWQLHSSRCHVIKTNILLMFCNYLIHNRKYFIRSVGTNHTRLANAKQWPGKVKVKIKVTLQLTVSQSVSLGVEPHLGFMTRYFFRSEYGIRLTVTFFIPWDALSDERTGLSFVCAAGLCQRSLSRS
jgi:hypothetical protein